MNYAEHAAALLLHRAALREERVMLVGHGIMNWLIAKELRVMGWKRHAGSDFAFWGCRALSW